MGRFAVFAIAVLAIGCSAHSSVPSPKTAPNDANSAARFAPPKIVEYSLPTADAGPIGIVQGSDGAMWFTEAFAPNIGRIDSNGEIREFNVGGSGTNFIAAGPDGNLWYTADPGIIGRLTPTGNLTVFTVPPPAAALETIAAGPDGRMWFVNIAQTGPLSSTVYMDAITTGGQITQYGPVPQVCYFPFGLTVGDDGNLWAAAESCLLRITPSGTITNYALGQNGIVSWIAAGLDGYLWTDDGRTNLVDQISYSGHIIRHFVNAVVHTNIYGMISVGSQIYFAEQGASRIDKIDEKSFVVKQFLIPTPGSYPSGLAEGADKNIWFTEFRGNKIGVLIGSVPRR
jgi:virginiamycin B lyase